MRYPQVQLRHGQRPRRRGAARAGIPKGQLGEDTSRLLGSLILARVWQAATARAAIPTDQRRDATLYHRRGAELPHPAPAALDTCSPRPASTGCRMVLAHQDLAQFPRDLLAAVSRQRPQQDRTSPCAPEDARVLARHTLPELDEHDLAHLDAYTAAARLVVDGRQTPAFTMRTRPPKRGRRGGHRHPADRRRSGARTGHQRHRRTRQAAVQPGQSAAKAAMAGTRRPKQSRS